MSLWLGLGVPWGQGRALCVSMATIRVDPDIPHTLQMRQDPDQAYTRLGRHEYCR